MNVPAALRLACLVLLAALGCGDDDAPPPDSGTDSGADAATSLPRDASLADAGPDDGGTPPGEWELPEAQRVGGKLPIYPLHPRPDAETGAGAAHRHAHPSVPYRVPVGIQGGEWPFRYELVEGPDGMRFVAGELERRMNDGRIEHLRTEGYGVLEWPSPRVGTHPVRVRVTDQAGESVELTWSVDTNAGAFVFVDSQHGDDDATGTFDAPLRTFADGLWLRDDDDASFAGRIAVFREGTYAVEASEAFTSPVLDHTKKPSAYLAFPDEAVTFDLSRGHFRTGSRGGIDDLVVAGIDFVGSREDLGNARLFNITNRSERVTFWECSFDDTGVGTAGTDNPACIAFMAAGPYHENLAVLGCELRANAGAQLVVTFDSRHVLFEGNRAVDVALAHSNGGTVLHAKDDTNDLTIRDNQLVGQVASAAIAVSNQISLGSAANQEICWNTLIYDGDQNVDSAFIINTQSTTPDAENTYVYRNSVVSQRRAMTFRGAAEPIPPLVEGNAFFGAEGGLVGENRTTGPVPNVRLEESDFDAEGRLVGEARSSHLGQAGAEVAAR
ncbi:MAG: hypothetical protein JJ863_27860 [Deltaproteobacteria bacterium]|nr:hypothetical protein [Deltaproteobacteria bacterium]